jgi:hypothetical protein
MSQQSGRRMDPPPAFFVACPVSNSIRAAIDLIAARIEFDSSCRGRRGGDKGQDRCPDRLGQ